MKYNIFINQLALHRIDKDLDVKDGAILDYIISFCSADDKKIDQLTYREGERTYRYTWIDYRPLIKEMPLLQFTTTTPVYQRIQKLKKAGLIKTKVIRSEERGQKKLYVRLTERIKDLFFKNDSPNIVELDPYHSKMVKHNTNKHNLDSRHL